MSRSRPSGSQTAALVLGSLLAFSTFAAAQTVSGTISGTAVDPSSLPVPGATVVVAGDAAGRILTGKADASGAFQSADVLVSLGEKREGAARCPHNSIREGKL